MAIDYIQITIFTVLGVIGLLGGIPQIIRWAKPKPHLTINKARVQRVQNDNYKHQIHLEVENQTKTFSRNDDATNVTVDYFIINKDNEQCATAQNQTISTYLVAGAKSITNIEAYHSLVPEGNPYSIIFLVRCKEETPTKKKIIYNAAQIEFT